MNPYIKYGTLPSYLLEASHDLHDLGIFELAWNRDNAIKVIETLQNKQVPLLGGDVYKIVDGAIEPAYDNWYTNNNSSIDCYCQGKQYILDYENKNGDSFLFVPVW